MTNGTCMDDFYDCEEVVAELSAKFASAAISEIDGKIEWALKRIGECLDLDRCTFWEISQSREEMHLLHQYAAPACKELPSDIKGEIFPWLFAKGLDGSPVIFNRLEELPEEAAVDKESLRGLGVKSAVLIPYQIAGVTIAGMTFGSTRQGHIFTEDQISKMKLIGEIMTGALHRMRMEEKYQAALKEVAHFKGNSRIEEFPILPETENEFVYEHIIGSCKAMQFVFSRIEQVAATDATILVVGETGTGKGVIASAIHNLSLRKQKRMITVNCAALPPNLIESELFGREKGAFTGSTNRQIGRFELADQGTLILDEIGELPLELQAKLLRAIQDGEFERLGSPETIKVNVRIFALTGKNLKEEVLQKRFRQDLFYRLNVFPINIPPLRERKEDIPLLANYFLKEFTRKMQKEINIIPQSIMTELISHFWPGNVRELEHVIERAVIITKGNSLQLAEKLEEQLASPAEESFITNLATIEKQHIIKVLEKTGWRIEGTKGAAILLGLHPNTLRGRMQKLGIHLRKSAL
ncbi:MAG: sigma 54-interacting transcriptional regulator [Smithellaceae bacterium]